MARNDEISSTDRLLSLIRGKGKKEPKLKSPSVAPSGASPKESKSSVTKVLALKKTITVGVDIGYDDLKLVKIRQFSNKKHELLDLRVVPFNPGLKREDPVFPGFLKETLSHFCGSSKKIKIWSSVSSARVEQRYLQIPKVPRKQIANAVYWTFKKETPFDEKEMVFDFDILGDITRDGLQKIEVVAFIVPQIEVEKLQGLFSDSGFPLTGVSVIPLAFQNLLRTQLIDSEANNICNLYIGRNWSRIDIFSNQNLVLSRGIKAGINSMLEAIREEIETTLGKEALGAPETEEGDLETTEEKAAAYESELSRKLFNGIEDGSFLTAEEITDLGLQPDEIFRMIQPAMDRLVRQMERTLGHFTLNFENRVVEKIFISGGITTHGRIVDYIGEQLGISRSIIDPFPGLPSASAKVVIPDAGPQRSSLAPAIGLALSNNLLTPNFICTYKDKEQLESVQRINSAVFRVFVALLVVCFSIYYWMEGDMAKKNARVAQLRQQLEQFSPRVNQNLILQTAAKIKLKKREFKAYTQKYQSLAVFSEISSLTPSNIRIISINVTLGGPPVKKPEKVEKTVLLDGIILGNKLTFEADLAGYLVRLKRSPLFDQLTVQKRDFEYYKNKPILRFRTRLRII